MQGVSREAAQLMDSVQDLGRILWYPTWEKPRVILVALKYARSAQRSQYQTSPTYFKREFQHFIGISVNRLPYDEYRPHASPTNTQYNPYITRLSISLSISFSTRFFSIPILEKKLILYQPKLLDSNQGFGIEGFKDQICYVNHDSCSLVKPSLAHGFSDCYRSYSSLDYGLGIIGCLGAQVGNHMNMYKCYCMSSLLDFH